MWWDWIMLGIETWSDLSAVIVVGGAVIAVVAWLMRVAVVRPLRDDLEELKTYVDNATSELRADSGESMRDRVIRIDTSVGGLNTRVGHLEARASSGLD